MTNSYNMKFLFIFLYYWGSVFAALDTEWWRHTIMYELLPQTFKDSDGDGIGDLKGIASKLDHFEELNIGIIYLTPCFKTGFLDMGYDIIDYNQIDPRYGSMEDFEELVRGINARGMKLMLDLVINHSSNEHEWFKKSVDRIDPYTDYYVWEYPKYNNKNQRKPPNRWWAFFGSSAWEWNEKRQQYYYHMFLPEQVDLNLRNEHVKQEIKNILKFWFDKGVAGFRMDAPMSYMEDPLLRELPYSSFLQDKSAQMFLKESYDFLHELRLYVDEYNNENGGIERILVPETWPELEPAKSYSGTKDYPMAHLTLNSFFEYVFNELNAAEFDNLVQKWPSYIPKDVPPTWVSQNHDLAREGSRIRYEYMDIFTITKAVLPGVMHVYYGEEIGMLDGFVREEQYQDYYGSGTRDPARLIMQWDDTVNAGFSTNEKPFSPPCTDYVKKNVELQKRQEISHYHLFKDVAALRKIKTLKYGDLSTHIYSAYVHVFWRSLVGEPTVIVVINFDYRIAKINLNEAVQNLSKNVSVAAASINSSLQKEDEVTSEDDYEFIMDPLTAIVFITDDD